MNREENVSEFNETQILLSQIFYLLTQEWIKIENNIHESCQMIDNVLEKCIWCAYVVRKLNFNEKYHREVESLVDNSEVESYFEVFISPL